MWLFPNSFSYGVFANIGSGAVPGRLPNHGFREGSGTGSGAVGDNTWAYSCVCVFFGGGKGRSGTWNFQRSSPFLVGSQFSRKKTKRTLANLRFSEQPL